MMNPPSRSPLLTLLAVMGLPLVALLYWQHDFFHDDAYISLRYARNLAEHGQLVWNLDEWVEGYTNFLHVILTAALLKLGVGPELAARSVNLLGLALLVVSLARGLLLILPGVENQTRRLILGATVAVSPPLAIWVMGGLEAVLLAGFVAAGAVSVLRMGAAESPAKATRAALGAGVWFSLAVLTRLDSAVFIGALGLVLLVIAPGHFPRRFGLAFLVAGVPTVTALVHMALRYMTYGELLPLTFYAKAGVPFGTRIGFLGPYLTFSASWAPLLMFALLAIPLLVLRGRRDYRLGVLALPFLAQIAYILWSGGDHMQAARVFVPLLVPGALLVALMLASFHQRLGTQVAVLTLVAALVPVLNRPALKMDDAAFLGRIVGRYIETTWSKGSLIALHTAGSTPFFAESMTFIDLLGLNDRAIAKRKNFKLIAQMQPIPGHTKGWGDYLLARQPDFYIAASAHGREVTRRGFLTDAELADTPEFFRCYRMEQVELQIPAEEAAIGHDWPNPITFTFYRRICDKDPSRPLPTD